jgi:hypothetical protein
MRNSDRIERNMQSINSEVSEPIVMMNIKCHIVPFEQMVDLRVYEGGEIGSQSERYQIWLQTHH